MIVRRLFWIEKFRAETVGERNGNSRVLTIQ